MQTTLIITWRDEAYGALSVKAAFRLYDCGEMDDLLVESIHAVAGKAGFSFHVGRCSWVAESLVAAHRFVAGIEVLGLEVLHAGRWSALPPLGDGPPEPGPAPGSPASGVGEAPAAVTLAYGTGRLADRAGGHGLETLDGDEVLELFLARRWPRRAAVLSERLLARFGDLAHVVGASLPELRQVVDAKVALDVKLLHDIGLRLLRAEVKKRPVLESWSMLTAYLRLKFGGVTTECFHVLFLDVRNQLIADEVMGRGTVNHAPVYPREIMRRGLELGASALILVHPHPSGDPEPSNADIAMTRKVIEAGEGLCIKVYDHVIVAAGETVSFRARGLI